MKISYLLSTHNETDTLSRLIERLINTRFDEDEIVILDDFSDNDTTKKILKETSLVKNVKLFQHKLGNNYSVHKNTGIQKCEGNWIFQIDGDELPSETLIWNIRDIINTNKEIELFFISRINDYRGVSPEISAPWGWRLTEMEFFRPYDHKKVKSTVVNYPDYQGRLFKNSYPRIHWERELHEKIEGANTYAFLPAEEELSLYHDKTIAQQLQTNLRYNKDFSVEANKGHQVI